MTDLSAVTDSAGRFKVLAIDHRDSMRSFLSPAAPDSVPAADITDLKVEVVRAIAPAATAVMLEPEFSIPQVIEAGAVPSGVGVIAALEAQGYMADPVNTVTEVLPGWSAQQAADAGAAMAKLLLPYHPDRHTAAAQEAVVEEVVALSHAAGLPVVVEPVAFQLEDPATHTDVILRSIERLQPTGVDVLKVPFPGRADDPDTWADACAAVSAVATVPWVILSGGGDFDDFAGQLAAAVTGGASGFMVGRALWGEAVRATGDERARLLRSQVAPRFVELCAITDAAATA